MHTDSKFTQLEALTRFHKDPADRTAIQAGKISCFRLTKGWNGDIDRCSTLLSQSLPTLKSRSPWC